MVLSRAPRREVLREADPWEFLLRIFRCLSHLGGVIGSLLGVKWKTDKFLDTRSRTARRRVNLYNDYCCADRIYLLLSVIHTSMANFRLCWVERTYADLRNTYIFARSFWSYRKCMRAHYANTKRRNHCFQLRPIKFKLLKM